MRVEEAKDGNFPSLFAKCYVQLERWTSWGEIPFDIQTELKSAIDRKDEVGVIISYDAIRLRWKRGEMDYINLPHSAVCNLDPKRRDYPVWIQERMDADYARANQQPSRGYDVTADPRLWDDNRDRLI